MKRCLYYIILVCRSGSGGFQLVFLTILAFTPLVKKQMWSFYRLLILSFPIMLSKSGERTMS